MKRHTAASTLTVLALASGALGIAAAAAVPASAASCSTVTVSSSGPLSALVLSVSSVSLTQGGCVTFHNATSEKASVSVDGSSAASLGAGASGGDWSASSAGVHAVTATVSGLLNLPKPGAGAITVKPKPKPPPAPIPSPTKVAGGTGGTGGTGGSGGSGGSGGGGSGGSSGGGGSAGGGSSSGGSGGSGSTGHKGLGTTHQRGPGAIDAGGLLGGTGFSLPSIPLGTFAHEGLAGAGIGTAPQIAPGIGASTDASGNPLPLVNGSGAQQMALAGDSHPSGSQSPIADVVAGLVVLGTAAGLLHTMRRRRAVDGATTTASHRA